MAGLVPDDVARSRPISAVAASGPRDYSRDLLSILIVDSTFVEFGVVGHGRGRVEHVTSG